MTVVVVSRWACCPLPPKQPQAKSVACLSHCSSWMVCPQLPLATSSYCSVGTCEPLDRIVMYCSLGSYKLLGLIAVLWVALCELKLTTVTSMLFPWLCHLLKCFRDFVVLIFDFGRRHNKSGGCMPWWVQDRSHGRAAGSGGGRSCRHKGDYAGWVDFSWYIFILTFLLCCYCFHNYN